MVGGSVTETKDEHPKKTLSPMVVIFEGSVTETNDEHPKKTLLPIVAMVGGSLICRREIQSSKAWSSINVMVGSTSTVVTSLRRSFLPPLNIYFTLFWSSISFNPSTMFYKYNYNIIIYIIIKVRCSFCDT